MIDHMVNPGPTVFPECGTFCVNTRKVTGKLGQVGHPIWKVSICTSLELEAAK